MGKSKGLPVGIAAITAFACGVVLAVLGMRYHPDFEIYLTLISQAWYVGPLALKAGPAPFGADVGFELGFGSTALLYPPLRYLEKKCFGR